MPICLVYITLCAQVHCQDSVYEMSKLQMKDVTPEVISFKCRREGSG